MLKLLYDLKVGFDDCYLTIKNQEFDLGYVIEKQKEANRESGIDTAAANSSFPNTEEGLFQHLWAMSLYPWNNLDVYIQEQWWYGYMKAESKAYFVHTYLHPICCSKDTPGSPTIWEPFNVQLAFNPNEKSKTVYDAAFSSSDACKLLGVSRQQLHYYVKTGKIKREFCEGVKSCRYNKDDVYKLLDEQNKKG